MSTQLIITLTIGLLGSGGIVAAIVALLKVRPETGQILVTTAQGVVIMQSGVIERLEKEIKRLSDELEEMRTENQKLRNRIREVEKQNGNKNGLEDRADEKGLV